jgi:PTS system mannose-specific IIA component
MIGILVVCHGNLAEGFKHAVSLIVGERERFSAIGVFEGDPIDDLPRKILAEVDALDEGDGVLVFVDLLGASPFNATVKAVSQIEGKKMDMITGANLPMILEAVMHRESGCAIEQLSADVLETGKNQMHTLTEMMSK